MKYSSMMTSKGQVTIPAVIRRKLGLKPGQAVQFTVSGNSVKVEAQDWRQGLAQLHQRVESHLRKQGLVSLTDAELDEAINAAGEAGATERFRRSRKG